MKLRSPCSFAGLSITALCGLLAPVSPAQSKPKFDAAAIHLCPASQGRGRGGAAPGTTSPGKLNETCQTVASLIAEAYDLKGQRAPAGFTSNPAEGGPPWLKSDRYSIAATVEGTPGPEVMRGVMLQQLLEDRFQLKLHQEMRERPVYALTVTKGGPKLQPTPEGSCVPMEAARSTPNLQPCGASKRGATVTPGAPTMMIGETIADLCRFLSLPDISDRPIIDQTGITGMFDIPLPGGGNDLFAMRRASPTDPIPDPLDSLRRLVQPFGMNLVSTKGTSEFIVIDHIERPSDN